MIKTFSLGNFKAFAETQTIPIKPLTLIFGANSAGKSSVIHGLLLAQHASLKQSLDVSEPLGGGKAVDLGGFESFVHRHDPSREVEIGFELDGTDQPVFVHSAHFSGLPTPLRLTSLIGIAVDAVGEVVTGARPECSFYELQTASDLLFRAVRTEQGRMRVSVLNEEHPSLIQMLQDELQENNAEYADAWVDPELTILSSANIKQAIKVLYGSSQSLLPWMGRDAIEGDSQRSWPHSREREWVAVAALCTVVAGLQNELKEFLSSEFRKLTYLGPLRSYPPRHLLYADPTDPNWIAGGGQAWQIVRDDEHVRKNVNRWLGAGHCLESPYELVVREHLDVADLEGPLTEALKILQERDNEGPGQPVLFDADEEAPSIISYVRERMPRRFPELLLRDQRRDTLVSHRDVGIGISQVLPVLATAYASKGGLIAMEQPEIHLHPALQAELGDLFIESALGENRNRFILETHSEHLILRVMRRMRETSRGELPAGSPKVTPDDVAVLFVEPSGTGSIVREMPLNERGELIKAWPGGFFEEGLREVLP